MRGGFGRVGQFRPPYSADVQSSQKTVAQRLPHEEKIPQGNALRSIPFLYLYLLAQAVWEASGTKTTLTALFSLRPTTSIRLTRTP